MTREVLFIRGLPRILQGIRRNVDVAGRRGPTATKETVMKRLIVGLSTTVLLWGGVAGVMRAGTAQAEPKAPVPLGSWPGCPEDSPSGACRWCPGDPPVQTGNLRTNPVVGTRISVTPIGTSISGRAMSPKTFSRETRHLHRRHLHLRRFSAPASSASRFSESPVPRREHRHPGIGARFPRLLGSVAIRTTCSNCASGVALDERNQP